jgi:ABC-type siderophore export system fused ATPase/permease subunit
MEKLNILLSKINNRILIVLLLIIPAGFCYRIIQMYQFESTGVSSEWTSIILIFLIAVELYLIIMFIWLRLIIHRKMSKTLKFIQLLLILLLGALPGISAIYPAFIKT